jgi:hypothetical protein
MSHLGVHLEEAAPSYAAPSPAAGFSGISYVDVDCRAVNGAESPS